MSKKVVSPCSLINSDQSPRAEQNGHYSSAIDFSVVISRPHVRIARTIYKQTSFFTASGLDFEPKLPRLVF